MKLAFPIAMMVAVTLGGMPVTAVLTSEEATGLLRGAGLRVTRQRVATLRALAVHRHATVDDIVTSLRDELPKVSFQAVYLVVADLLAAGLVSRLDESNEFSYSRCIFLARSAPDLLTLLYLLCSAFCIFLFLLYVFYNNSHSHFSFCFGVGEVQMR